LDTPDRETPVPTKIPPAPIIRPKLESEPETAPIKTPERTVIISPLNICRVPFPEKCQQSKYDSFVFQRLLQP
jgi:hypothetical protein